MNEARGMTGVGGFLRYALPMNSRPLILTRSALDQFKHIRTLADGIPGIIALMNPTYQV